MFTNTFINTHLCTCWGFCHCRDYYCPCCGQRKPQPCNPWRPAPRRDPWYDEPKVHPQVGEPYNPTRPKWTVTC